MGTEISQDEKTHSVSINAFISLVMRGYQNYGIEIEFETILGGLVFKIFTSMVRDHQTRHKTFN